MQLLSNRPFPSWITIVISLLTLNGWNETVHVCHVINQIMHINTVQKSVSGYATLPGKTGPTLARGLRVAPQFDIQFLGTFEV